MRIIEIDDDNAEEFNIFLNEDLIEDIGRKFYRGIGALNENDEAAGVFIYELLGVNSDIEATKCRIIFAGGDDDEALSAMIGEYDNRVVEDNIELTTYETTDERVAAALERAGFTRETRPGSFIRFRVGDLEKVKLKLNMNIPGYIVGISEASFLQFRNGIKNFLFKGVKCAAEDIAFLPMSWFDKDVSSCCITDGKVDGMFLIRRNPSGSMQAILYTCTGPDSRRNLAYMLIRSVNMALNLYSHEDEVMINCRNKEISNLVEHILPGIDAGEVFAGSREG